jgi:hypothetical protein
VAERGFFAALNGYEAQVFLDIHEVEDSPQGHWARLNWELNGRGAPDIYASIEDLAFAELYAVLSKIFKSAVSLFSSSLKEEKSSPALFPSSSKEEKPAPSLFPSVSEEKKSEASSLFSSSSAEEKKAEIKSAVFEFVRIGTRYLRGADGACDPFPASVSGKSAEADPELTAEIFAQYIARFLGFSEQIAGLSGLEALRKDLETAVFAPAVAGYGLLILLRAVLGRGVSGAASAALADHWHLWRKLREWFGESGFSGDEAYRAGELMRAILARTVPETVVPAQSGNPAENLILEHYQAEDFRRILGVNRFEDTIWFNKEAFETALRYAPLFAALEVPGAFEKAASRKAADSALSETQWRKRLKSIAEITGAFAAAERQSEYRLEGLIEALGAKPEIKPAPKKKTAKKNAP